MRERRAWLAMAAGALAVTAMWLSWFFAPGFWSESLDLTRRASHVDYYLLEVVLIAIILLFGWYVWIHSHHDPPLVILAGLLVMTAMLIVVFASAYFNFGSVQNFTGGTLPRLTHIDALSLAVGNLSTAGSKVVPHSQWARGIVMTQQLVDFAFLGFIASIAIGRLRAPGTGETKPESGMEQPSDPVKTPTGRLTEGG